MNETVRHEPPTVTADEYARRLRVLLGLGNSGGLPRRQKDRWILLHAIAARFGADERLGERDATVRIQDFLLGPGRALGIDAVTFRRLLVDEGFVDRSDRGTDYRASDRHARHVRFEGVMPAVERALAGGVRV